MMTGGRRPGCRPHHGANCASCVRRRPVCLLAAVRGPCPDPLMRPCTFSGYRPLVNRGPSSHAQYGAGPVDSRAGIRACVRACARLCHLMAMTSVEGNLEGAKKADCQRGGRAGARPKRCPEVTSVDAPILFCRLAPATWKRPLIPAASAARRPGLHRLRASICDEVLAAKSPAAPPSPLAGLPWPLPLER